MLIEGGKIYYLLRFREKMDLIEYLVIYLLNVEV